MENVLLLKHELLLVILLVFLLMAKIGEWMKPAAFLAAVNILLAINLAAGFFCNSAGSMFGGMFYTNELICIEKNILSFGTLLISLQAYDWLKQHRHAPEFYMLLLAALLGMQFMLSANHFVLFYLGLELSAIPLAVLASFDLPHLRSSEAGMKMIFSSAFSSCFLLFGLSLLYGTTGTLSFEALPALLDGSPLQVFAFILVFSGFAFKMSVVPFHLWTADVYEGSPVAVTSFLSVISKGAAVFVFFSVLYRVFGVFEQKWTLMLWIFSILTMTIGNIAALQQQNIKRLLAFSSVAQVGYIMLGISGGRVEGSASAVFFVLVYICSNLAALGVVTAVSRDPGKETLSDYRGLSKTNPAYAWILLIALFSLAGIPPTAGFFGKILLLTSGASKADYIVIILATLNMVVSLYYYLRVVKAMFIEKNDEEPVKVQTGLPLLLSVGICIAGVAVIGFIPRIYEYISGVILSMVK